MITVNNWLIKSHNSIRQNLKSIFYTHYLSFKFCPKWQCLTVTSPPSHPYPSTDNPSVQENLGKRKYLGFLRIKEAFGDWWLTPPHPLQPTGWSSDSQSKNIWSGLSLLLWVGSVCPSANLPGNLLEACSWPPKYTKYTMLPFCAKEVKRWWKRIVKYNSNFAIHPSADFCEVYFDLHDFTFSN